MTRSPARPPHRRGTTWAQSALNRRGFLQAMGLTGAALAAGPLLSACGTEGTANSDDAAASGDPKKLAWSNWPLYLDTSEEDENDHPTLTAFTEKTGIEVTYTEDVNDNDEFFGKISPMLRAGRSTGRDVIVLTDWMAARMIRLDYVEKIDRGNIPNSENLIASYEEVPFDKGRQYSLPWQSGIAGIGYNPVALGREITEIDDLFQPDLKGRLTMLTEMRDTMGLLLLSMGKSPEDHTFADYKAAIAKLQKVVDDGYVRAFTGNEYAADLASGNILAAVAWSGDVIQLQADDPDMQLLVPGDGGMLFSDNLMVPKGAANKAGAEQLMDFYYDPKIAAEVAAYVNYVTPVQGAQDAMQDLDPDLASNELIFPTEKTLSTLHSFKSLDEGEEKEYQDLFQKVIGA
jgi:spermidine/putrescine transport system substrate-binding protein